MALTSTLEMVVVALATPIFVWFASKWGKKRIYLMLIISWAIVTLSLVMFVTDFKSPLYWCLELGTAIFGDTQTVFAQAILADVVDYDQLLWGGSKRAAIYSCVLSDGQGLDQVTDALQYGLMAAVGFHTSDDAISVRVDPTTPFSCHFVLAVTNHEPTLAVSAFALFDIFFLHSPVFSAGSDGSVSSPPYRVSSHFLCL